MSLNNKRNIKPLDLLQILFAVFMAVAYLYFLLFTDYLDSWYLKIGVGIASIGGLIGGIIHCKKTYK